MNGWEEDEIRGSSEDRGYGTGYGKVKELKKKVSGREMRREYAEKTVTV